MPPVLIAEAGRVMDSQVPLDGAPEVASTEAFQAGWFAQVTVFSAQLSLSGCTATPPLAIVTVLKTLSVTLVTLDPARLEVSNFKSPR
jgi:hypothetical protein